MVKRFLCTLVGLVVPGLLLSACNIAVHAQNAPVPSLGAHASDVILATPTPDIADMFSAITASPPDTTASPAPPVPTPDSSNTQPTASAPIQPVFPQITPDFHMKIIYKATGQQNSDIARTTTGTFPAQPDFSIHITCTGYGYIRVSIGNSVINMDSCPRRNNVGKYFIYPAPSTIQITTQGSILWEVVVEGEE